MTLLSVCFAVSVGLGPASAQEFSSPRAGHDFAMAICAECHWVSDEQLLIPDSDAPTVFDVADDPAVTATALRVFFGTSHQKMPNIMLSADERDNLIAYILSLRKQQ